MRPRPWWQAQRAKRILGARLADGWKRYFGWEIAITGAGTLILVGAVTGWRRLPHGTTIKLLAAGLVVAEAINLGAIMITAYSAPALLRQVPSLNELVGTETPLPRIRPTGPPLPGVQVVVIGDSTAAGAGLAPLHGASGTARACGRSADSYAFGGAASTQRIGRHRQRRCRRPGLGRHGAVLRGHGALRRPRYHGLLAAAARLVPPDCPRPARHRPRRPGGRTPARRIAARALPAREPCCRIATRKAGA